MLSRILDSLNGVTLITLGVTGFSADIRLHGFSMSVDVGLIIGTALYLILLLVIHIASGSLGSETEFSPEERAFVGRFMQAPTVLAAVVIAFGLVFGWDFLTASGACYMALTGVEIMVTPFLRNRRNDRSDRREEREDKAKSGHQNAGDRHVLPMEDVPLSIRVMRRLEMLYADETPRDRYLKAALDCILRGENELPEVFDLQQRYRDDQDETCLIVRTAGGRSWLVAFEGDMEDERCAVLVEPITKMSSRMVFQKEPKIAVTANDRELRRNWRDLAAALEDDQFDQLLALRVI